MREVLFLLLLFILSIGLSNLLLPPTEEGFTSYFRQIDSPRMRKFRDVHQSITSQFDIKFKEFGRTFGFV